MSVKKFLVNDMTTSMWMFILCLLLSLGGGIIFGSVLLSGGSYDKGVDDMTAICEDKLDEMYDVCHELVDAEVEVAKQECFNTYLGI